MWGSGPLALAFTVAPTFLATASLLRLATLPTLVLGRNARERLWAAIDRALYTSYQSLVSFFYEHWSGVELRFHGDPVDPADNALYFSNHSYCRSPPLSLPSPHSLPFTS